MVGLGRPRCGGHPIARVFRAHRRDGHATRIAFGVDTRLDERLHLSLAATYQGIMMPNFALADVPARDTSFHSCVLSIGVWFGA